MLKVCWGKSEMQVFRRSGFHLYRIRVAGREQYLSVHSILFLLVPLFELLNPAGRVHQFLLAGIKWVAVRADIYGPVVYSGPGLVGSTAGTGKCGLFVFRVQLFFHP